MNKERSLEQQVKTLEQLARPDGNRFVLYQFIENHLNKYSIEATIECIYATTTEPAMLVRQLIEGILSQDTEHLDWLLEHHHNPTLEAIATHYRTPQIGHGGEMMARSLAWVEFNRKDLLNAYLGNIIEYESGQAKKDKHSTLFSHVCQHYDLSQAVFVRYSDLTHSGTTTLTASAALFFGMARQTYGETIDTTLARYLLTQLVGAGANLEAGGCAEIYGIECHYQSTLDYLAMQSTHSAEDAWVDAMDVLLYEDIDTNHITRAKIDPIVRARIQVHPCVVSRKHRTELLKVAGHAAPPITTTVSPKPKI